MPSLLLLRGMKPLSKDARKRFLEEMFRIRQEN